MFNLKLKLLIAVPLLAATGASAFAQGTLVIMGGGMNSTGPAVRQRILDAVGGPAKCRAAIFPTASNNLDGAAYIADLLRKLEVPKDQIHIVNIFPQNAPVTAYSPANADLVRGCNVIYFTGGVQERITQSLLQKDGKDTPVLEAIRDAVKRGGVLAGTSAGAAMQSEHMISAGGLPDAMIDEGMDALDFGVSNNYERRGLSAKAGLGFFKTGIIDQHFGQYRGRLSRLSRALVAQKMRHGFGIDENTALIVGSDGVLEVCGEGYLTVIDAQNAKCEDGPLGCHLQNLRVSCYSNGDKFNPATSEAMFPEGKVQLQKHADAYRGNFPIPDMHGRNALSLALIRGLADNTARRQEGIALRYVNYCGHGYRYTFRKTEQSRSWGGKVHGDQQFAAENIELGIEPILSNLQSPSLALPVDLPAGSAGVACQAIWFRGILTANDDRKLRPEADITRSEFAQALASAVHLVTPLHDHPQIKDVADEAREYDAIARVLEAGLLQLDGAKMFHPRGKITRTEAEVALQQALKLNAGDTRMAGQLKDLLAGDPTAPLTRQAAAEALSCVLGFRW